MTSLIFHPLAQRELIEAARFYESQLDGLGVTFIRQVERTLARVIRNPNAGSSVSGPVRRRLVRRFPFAVLYQPAANDLYVIAIAHLRRKPGYWKIRLKNSR